MRARIRRISLLSLAIAASGIGAEAPAQLQGFTFTATGNGCPDPVVCDQIPSSWMAQRPNAAVFLTSNWNPAGSPGVYFDRYLATDYAFFGPFQYHVLFGWSGDDPLPGAHFNALAMGTLPTCVFQHVSSAANSLGNVTLLDRPSLNGNPGAFLQLQEIAGAATPHPIGVYYDSASSNRWGIFNEDQQTMAAGREFWVLDGSCPAGIPAGLNVFNCTPEAGFCYLDSPQYSNGKKGMLLLVTQKWSFANAVYNPHPIGVFYNPTTQMWAIFNEDGTPIPAGAEFFVAFVGAIFSSNFEQNDLDAWSGIVP